MRQRTEIELAKFRLLKTIRTGVRMKYANIIDAELNTVLPEAEAEFDSLVLGGTLPSDEDIAGIAYRVLSNE